MSDNLLDKYTGKRTEPPTVIPETEGTEDCGAFGWLRGIRERSVMLEIRYKDGRVTALGYAWLDLVEYDPSEGIKLKFSGKTVEIMGSNLNGEVRPNIRLLDGIIRHRVPWIQEAASADVLKASGDSVIIEQVKSE